MRVDWLIIRRRRIARNQHTGIPTHVRMNKEVQSVHRAKTINSVDEPDGAQEQERVQIVKKSLRCRSVAVVASE